MHPFRQVALAGIATLALSAPAQAYIDIVFDYRFDTSGYFTADKREALNQAAYAFESRFTDELAGFTSNPTGDRFEANTGHWGSVPNLSVGQNQVLIFVGASANYGNAKENGIPVEGASGGGFMRPINASAAFRSAVHDRGQAAGALDAASWGGSLKFSSTANWYVDDDFSTVESFAGQYDFYTAALKGLLDIFSADGGDNSSVVWSSSEGVLDNRARFKGANAKALNGGLAIATEPYGNHRLQAPFMSTVEGSNAAQLAVFSHGLGTGERRYLTELDYAMLKDLGWEVGSLADAPPYMPAVPEPTTWAMLVAGLGLIGYTARKRRSM